MLALACVDTRPARAADRRTVTVLAAASLKDVFTQLAARFERAHPDVTVSLSCAGSQELRLQIEHGARADVFAAADLHTPHALAAAGLIETPAVFAQNRLTLVVPRTNPAKLTRFEDLPRATRVVLGVREVPIGGYAETLLSRAARALGPDFAAKVRAHVVSRELNVKQILAKVTLGEADAAFVYETDARAAGDKVTVIPVPPAFAPIADYPVAVLRAAPQKPLAQALVAMLRGPIGQELLLAAGFRIPATVAAGAAPAPR